MLQTIPLDVYKETLLRSSPQSFMKMCQLNKQSNDICNNLDNSFWYEYLDTHVRFKPTHYGYASWIKLKASRNYSWLQLLDYLDYYDNPENSRVLLMPVKIYNEDEFDYELSDHKIEIIVLNTDTVGDILNRIKRGFKLMNIGGHIGLIEIYSYKNKNIKILYNIYNEFHPLVVRNMRYNGEYDNIDISKSDKIIYVEYDGYGFFNNGSQKSDGIIEGLITIS
jgi:hypothetical protein